MPVEPTEQMIDAWFRPERGVVGDNTADFSPAYHAMLNAAPEAPNQ